MHKNPAKIPKLNINKKLMQNKLMKNNSQNIMEEVKSQNSINADVNMDDCFNNSQ
jgi:hypothetical protein